MLKARIKEVIKPLMNLNFNEEGNVDLLVGVIYREIVLKEKNLTISLYAKQKVFLREG